MPTWCNKVITPITRSIRCWVAAENQCCNSIYNAPDDGRCTVKQPSKINQLINEKHLKFSLKTLRRHLHLLGLLDSPMCRKCGVREETSAHILCECEALASLRHVYLGSFFLEPVDIRSIGLGAIWNFSKATGLPWFDMGHKGPA